MLQQVLFPFNHISIDISNRFDIISPYISLEILLIISGIAASLAVDMRIFYQEQYCTERFFNRLVIIF